MNPFLLMTSCALRAASDAIIQARKREVIDVDYVDLSDQPETTNLITTNQEK